MPSATDETVYFDNTGGPSPDKRVHPNEFIKECFLPWPAGRLSTMSFDDTDPRQILRNQLSSGTAQGWVLVRPEMIEAVCGMRVCRSTAVFDSDEDGAITPRVFYCVLEAGHNHRHTNGYFNWQAKPLKTKPPQVRLLEWVNKQIANLKGSPLQLDATSHSALDAYESVRQQLAG